MLIPQFVAGKHGLFWGPKTFGLFFNEIMHNLKCLGRMTGNRSNLKGLLQSKVYTKWKVYIISAFNIRNLFAKHSIFSVWKLQLLLTFFPSLTWKKICLPWIYSWRSFEMVCGARYHHCKNITDLNLVQNCWNVRIYTMDFIRKS